MLIAYCPLARGIEARQYIKKHGGQMNLFKEKCMQDLVKKYNMTPGQITLNWDVTQGVVAIPGTSNPKRMEENLGALHFEMSEEDLESLKCFGKKLKFCGCRSYFGINIMA